MADRRVKVKLADVNWMVQLLDLKAIGPVIVETAPEFTVMVPASSPVHVGWVGTPFGATAMVYGSDVPVSVPVRVPFSSTVPLGRPMRTGPVTDVADWVRSHVIRPVTFCTTRSPVQRPVTFPCVGCVGVLGVVSSVQPHNAAAQMRTGRRRTDINETDAEIVPVLSWWPSEEA
jgi:hypothetical protein